MKKYRKKPIIIEAKQWFKIGDHEKVKPFDEISKQYWQECAECHKSSKEHGIIKTLEGKHYVCPGDWIIKNIKNEFYPCKPDIFEKTYEEVL